MNDDPSPVAEADSDADRHEQDGAANGAGAIGRRRYLHVAGGALGALATGAVGVGHAQEVTIRADTDRNIDAKDASDSITLSPGESIQVHVGENQYGYYGDLENVLIDITAEGADAIVTSHGGEWVIRNVGIRGESNGDLSYRPLISAKTKDSTHTGLIEHVYLGDGGNHGGHGSGRAGIHVAYGHRGTVTVRDLNVANWTDNGVYGSSPGKDGGGGGVVEIENSYGKNNNIANFRIGTPGSSVRDSISVAEGTQTDLNICRGVWCRHRDSMVVENTDIDLSGPAATPAVVASKGGSVTYRDSEYSTTYEYGDFKGDLTLSNLGTNPSTTPPAGVPTSAAAAASGGSGSDPVPANRLRIEAVGERSTYEFDVSGALEPGSTFDTDGSDGISGPTGSGRVVGSGTDDFYFDGGIVRFVHDGPLRVFVDGTERNPDSLGAPHQVSIVGDGTGVGYDLAVSGAVEKSTARNGSINAGDDVSGSSASGWVGGGTDSYGFSGRITDLSVADPSGVTVYLDGRQVDPGLFPPEHTLSISGGPTDYEFTVSGALGKNTAQGGSINAGDDVSGSTASGVVGGGTDSYSFDGEITDFTVEDTSQATVYLDGQQVDPRVLGLDHTLSIIGRGTGVGYEFSVSGALQKSTARNGSINSGDSINGSTATGNVFGGTDSYGFDGEISDFTIEDASQVTVYLDGSEVDPRTLGMTRTLSIDGDSGHLVAYDLQVSGSLQKSDAMGATIDANDELSGSSARGQVNGGIDSYAFGGEIEYLAIDARYVTVYLDGEQVDPGRFPPPNEITVSNRPFDRPATYDFGVSGALQATDSVNFTDGDGISGTSASGRVNQGSDTYRFSGKVTDLAHDGPVEVFVNGEQVQ
jgi:hypothetical protein